MLALKKRHIGNWVLLLFLVLGSFPAFGQDIDSPKPMESFQFTIEEIKGFSRNKTITEKVQKFLPLYVKLYLWSKDNFALKDYPKAMALINEVSDVLFQDSNWTKTPDLIALKAITHLLKQQPLKAVEVLKQFSESYNSHLWINISQCMVGTLEKKSHIHHWRLNRLKLQELTKKYPEHDLIHSLYTESIFEEIQTPKPSHPLLNPAKNSLLKAIQLNPSQLYYQYQKGQLLYLQNHSRQAQTLFQNLTTQHSSTVLQEAIGNFYVWMRDFVSAKDYYQRVQSNQPRQIRIYKKLELIYAQQFPEKIEEMYKAAISKYPDFFPFYQRLLSFYTNYGMDKTRTLNFFTNAALKYPQNANILLLLARIYEEEDLPKAINTYQKVIQLNPRLEPTYSYLIEIYWQQKEIKKISPLIDQAFKYLPTYSEGYYWKGILAVQNRKPKEAITNLKRALWYNPELHEAKNILAVAYRLNREYKKSLELLQDAYKLNPGNLNNLLNLGDVYYEMKQYKKSEKYYLMASELQPLNQDILFSLGTLYTNSKEFNKAIKTFQRVILLKPKALDARNNLGNIYLKQQAYPEAIKQFKLILDMTPTYTPAIYNLACAYALDNNPGSALKHLKDAIKLDTSLKDLAKTDPDLSNLRKEEKFKALFK